MGVSFHFPLCVFLRVFVCCQHLGWCAVLSGGVHPQAALHFVGALQVLVQNRAFKGSLHTVAASMGASVVARWVKGEGEESCVCGGRKESKKKKKKRKNACASQPPGGGMHPSGDGRVHCCVRCLVLLLLLLF